ncbi:MAG: LytTR family DNA-binding domain-containing protein [Acidobacteriaceae bacterium]
MTKTIGALIADDERLAREKLRLLLSNEPGIHILAECADVGDTVTQVLERKPDLLFLDVQMPGGDGFEVLKQIPAESLPVVIFTTAYDQYAIRAFEANALDYLLKPFDEERFHRTLERVRKELAKARDFDLRDRLLEFLANSRGKPKAERRLVIKTGGRVVFLEVDEIDWLEAAANYVQINVGKTFYLIRESITGLMGKLDPAQFVRIHRSIIVNLRMIKELQPCNSGEYIVVLKNGKELSCSRSYRGELQQLIESM